jgi:hypothetical protein
VIRRLSYTRARGWKYAGPILILAAGVVAALAVRFDGWIWLRATAAGLATSAVLAAAYFNREQARQARAQVEAAERAQARAMDEAADRSVEALRAQNIAQATLAESVKSRLDGMAPQVSVILNYSVMIRVGFEENYESWDALAEEIPASYLEARRLKVTLRFDVTNHGQLPVPMFIPGNPLSRETRVHEGHGVILPNQRITIAYFVDMDFVNWRSTMRTGFGPQGHPDNPWRLTYNFQFTDPTGQITDTHVWQGDICPFATRDDGSIQRLSPAVNGLVVASVARIYSGLDEAQIENNEDQQ